MKRHQVATTKLYGLIHILILLFAVLQIGFIIAQFFTYFHNPSIVCVLVNRLNRRRKHTQKFQTFFNFVFHQ